MPGKVYGMDFENVPDAGFEYVVDGETVFSYGKGDIWPLGNSTMEAKEAFGMCEDDNIFSHICHPEKEVLLEWSIKTDQIVSLYPKGIGFDVSYKYSQRYSDFLFSEIYSLPEHSFDYYRCLPKNRCMKIEISIGERSD